MITCISDPDSAVISRRLTQDLVGLYERSSHRPFLVALSGGSTPSELYRYWLHCPDPILSRDIHFFWVDERMVPADSSQSNYGNACRDFFTPVGFPSLRLHPIVFDPRKDVATIAKDYTEEVLRYTTPERGGVLFDLAILGMGEDGHTSSLFPCEPFCADTDVYIPSIHPQTRVERVALSYAGIAKCVRIWFHVLGESKSRNLCKSISQVGQKELSFDDLLPAARAMRLNPTSCVYTNVILPETPAPSPYP